MCEDNEDYKVIDDLEDQDKIALKQVDFDVKDVKEDVKENYVNHEKNDKSQLMAEDKLDNDDLHERNVCDKIKNKSLISKQGTMHKYLKKNLKKKEDSPRDVDTADHIDQKELKKKSIVKKIASYKNQKQDRKKKKTVSSENQVTKERFKSEESQNQDFEMIATKDPEILVNIKNIEHIPRGSTQPRISCYFGPAVNQGFRI